MLELLNGHPDRLFDTIKINIVAFRALCRRVTKIEVLDHNKLISVEEAIVMFLRIISHNIHIRTMIKRYQHSVKIVCCQFTRVLDAMCHLGRKVIRPPDFNIVQAEIENNPKYYPWFKVSFVY